MYVQYCTTVTASSFYALVYFHTAQNFTQHIPKFWFTISEEDQQLEQFLQNLSVYQVAWTSHLLPCHLGFSPDQYQWGVIAKHETQQETHPH